MLPLLTRLISLLFFLGLTSPAWAAWTLTDSDSVSSDAAASTIVLAAHSTDFL